MTRNKQMALIEGIAERDVTMTLSAIKDGADVRGLVGVLSMLHFAAMVGSSNVVEVLLRAGADVDRGDDVGQTPLHYVGISTSPDAGEIVDQLLTAGAKVNAKDSRGRTALDNAAGAHNYLAARRLMQAGGTCKAQYRTWLRSQEEIERFKERN